MEFFCVYCKTRKKVDKFIKVNRIKNKYIIDIKKIMEEEEVSFEDDKMYLKVLIFQKIQQAIDKKKDIYYIPDFDNEFSIEKLLNLKKILGADYQEGVEINEAALKKALVQIVKPANFADISALVVSVASDNPDLQMQELAVINPIKSTVGKIKLKPSPSADATDYFAEKSMYLILDATFTKDVDANVTLKGSFEFELKY